MTKAEEIAVSALANSMGGRKGAPPIDNVIALLPDDIKSDLTDDVRAIFKALLDAGLEVRETHGVDCPSCGDATVYSQATYQCLHCHLAWETSVKDSEHGSD